jgi:hypothetical protein
LLAGIFGSAFVPSALAARETAGLADIKPRYSILTAGASVLANDDEDAFAIKSSVSNETLAAVGATLSVTLFSAGALGDGTTGVATADIKVTSSSPSLLVSVIDDGEACTANDGAADLFSQSDTFLDAVEHTVGGEDYFVCLAGATATSSVKDATVTISARRTDSTGAYTVIDTVKVSVLGAVDSLTLAIADGYKYVVVDNVAVPEWFSIKGFDAAGNLLNGGDGTVTEGETLPSAPNNWEDNPENGEETVVNPLDEATAVEDADATAGGTEETLYGLEAAACVAIEDDEATSDIGRSYSVRVQDGTDADVVSNAVVITCTGADARISKISASDTVGPELYDDGTGDNGDLNIIATFVDEDGRPFGDGNADELDFGDLSFDGAAALVTELELADIDTTDIAEGAILGGETVLAHISDGFDFGRRGQFTYTVEITEPDLGDADEDEVTFTLRYVATGSDDVTISRTRNAAKTRATISADMGEENAYLRVEFFVELANGDLKTYTRRANDAGVAVLIQSRRNTTIYVYADLAGDDAGSPTDVLAVKFK